MTRDLEDTEVARNQSPQCLPDFRIYFSSSLKNSGTSSSRHSLVIRRSEVKSAVIAQGPQAISHDLLTSRKPKKRKHDKSSRPVGSLPPPAAVLEEKKRANHFPEYLELPTFLGHKEGSIDEQP